jgi:hypothetical protein
MFYIMNPLCFLAVVGKFSFVSEGGVRRHEVKLEKLKIYKSLKLKTLSNSTFH